MDILHQMVYPDVYDMENVCQFISSSGTTGKPKLITHSFSNKATSAHQQYLPLFRHYESEDIWSPSEYPSGCRVLLTGSTFHVTTYNLISCSMAHGHCVVIPTPKEKSRVSELWRLMAVTKVNASCFLSSSIYALLQHGQSIDGNHLKTAFVTGEIIPSQLIRKFMRMMASGVGRDTANPMRISNFYGTTECEVIGFSNPIAVTEWDAPDLYDRVMTIRKCPGIELKVNNEADRELQISTPCLMKGYFNDVSKTDEVVTVDEQTQKRWYLVGEEVQFMAGDDASFRIMARNKDLFITDGSTCYPQAVEDVLLKHDRVNGAVVIGIGYSDIYIEEGLPGLDHPVAFVTANLDRSELTEEGLVEELLVLCDAHLQRDLGEIPIKIFVMTDIPKTTNGKILRNDLKSMAIEYFAEHKLQYSLRKSA